MNKSVEKEQVQKFLLYSGHDTTCKSTISHFKVPSDLVLVQ